MSDEHSIKELYELVFSLQAEISAFKELMFQANPDLAKRHQDLTNEIREQLLLEWRKNRP